MPDDEATPESSEDPQGLDSAVDEEPFDGPEDSAEGADDGDGDEEPADADGADQNDAEDPDDEEADGAEEPVAPRTTSTRRTPAAGKGSTSAKGQGSKVARTNAEKRTMMIMLDDREGKFVFVAAILAAFFALIESVPYMVAKIQVATPQKPIHKTCMDHYVYVKSGGGTCNTVYPPSHYVPYLIIGLVFAAGLYITRRVGRRVPAAFVSLITGLFLGLLFLIIVFGPLAGWLFLRAYRVQKWGSPTARGPVSDDRGEPVLGAGALREAPSPRGASRNGRSASSKGSASSTSGRGSGRKGRVAPPAGPTANKRYTPKAPTRRPPPARPAKDG